jgi:hypothetical protein
MAYPSGKTTARYCSKSCASLDRDPEIDKRAGDKRRKPLVEKVCMQCGRVYYLKSMGQLSAGQKFCSKRCAAIYRFCGTKVGMEYAARMRRGGNGWKGKKNPTTAERMRTKNPMYNPDVKERARQALVGRTFLSRGGNGQLTPQQVALCQALGLPESAMEFVIPTAGARQDFESLPPAYKVDLGIPEVRLAIEVDGRTHKLKKWKFLDRRKTAVLNFLGWSVLRFWNEEVDQDLTRCVQMVWSTISRLKETITTSLMES